MRLTDYLHPENIRLGLQAESKEALLEAMISLIDGNPHVHDTGKVRSAILEREKIMSTGVGKNFAIPHGKTDSVDEIVLAFAVTANPVEYQSMDSEPVRLVLLLISRDSLVGQRLKLLSRASKIMNNEEARLGLMAAKTIEEVLAIFHAEEDKIGET